MRDDPMKLGLAANMIGMRLGSLRKHHLNRTQEFDESLLNVTRTSSNGNFVVKPSEVMRYIEYHNSTE